MLINEELSQISDLDKLNTFVESLTPSISTCGGRRYSKGADSSLCLNDIVNKLVTLTIKLTDQDDYSSKHEHYLTVIKNVDTSISKINKLDTDGNKLLSDRNFLVKILTYIRQLFGNYHAIQKHHAFDHTNRSDALSGLTKLTEDFRKKCEDCAAEQSKKDEVKALSQQGTNHIMQREFQKAITCFKKAHEAGEETAWLVLQNLYVEHGLADSPERAAAIAWFLEAAEDNNVFALGRLAVWHSTGAFGFEQNEDLSKEYADKRAEAVKKELEEEEKSYYTGDIKYPL